MDTMNDIEEIIESSRKLINEATKIFEDIEMATKKEPSTFRASSKIRGEIETIERFCNEITPAGPAEDRNQTAVDVNHSNDLEPTVVNPASSTAPEIVQNTTEGQPGSSVTADNNQSYRIVDTINLDDLPDIPTSTHDQSDDIIFIGSTVPAPRQETSCTFLGYVRPVEDVPPVRRPTSSTVGSLTKPGETPGNSVQNKNNNEENVNAAAPAPGSVLMCAVCMESSIRRKPTSTTCGHVFCLDCINKALQLSKKCPLCNTKLGKNSCHRIFVD